MIMTTAFLTELAVQLQECHPQLSPVQGAGLSNMKATLGQSEVQLKAGLESRPQRSIIPQVEKVCFKFVHPKTMGTLFLDPFQKEPRISRTPRTKLVTPNGCPVGFASKLTLG